MANRQGSNRNNVKTHKIPELEIQTAAWYLPGNPINADAYPWIFIREAHDLVELKAIAKTPGGTSFICDLQQAFLSGDNIGAFSSKGSVTINASVNHGSNSSLTSPLNQGAGAIYRLVPTSVPTAIRDITISLVYRKNLVSE